MSNWSATARPLSHLLNRCITRAHSISDARQALQDLGYDVLATAVPRLEVYAQSFGMPIAGAGGDVWREVAHELVSRCAPSCQVAVMTAVGHPDRNG